MQQKKQSRAFAMKALAGALACAGLFGAAPADADTLSFSNTVVTAPTTFWPSITLNGAQFNTFAGTTAGTNSYATGSFYVGGGSNYSLSLTYPRPPGIDEVVFVLRGTFTPSSTSAAAVQAQIPNFIAARYGASPNSLSGLNLAAGQYSYLIVMATSGNTPVAFIITGPGCISLAGPCGVSSTAALNGNALALGQWNDLLAGFDRIDSRLDGLRFSDAGGVAPVAYSSSDPLTGMAAGDAAPKHGVWVRLVGTDMTQATSQAAGGYNGRARGLAGGYDIALTPNTTVGAAFGYTTTSYGFQDQFAGQAARIDDYQLALYASHEYRIAYVDTMVGYAKQNYSVSRNFGGTNGEFNGSTFSVRLGGGVPLRVTEATTVVPQARLTYGYLRQNAYNESGAAAMMVQGNHAERLRGSLGAQVNVMTQIGSMKVQPFTRAFWNYEFKRDGLITSASLGTPGSEFTATGANLPRDTYTLGVGANFLINSRLSAVAGYDYDAGSGYKANTVRVAGRWVF